MVKRGEGRKVMIFLGLLILLIVPFVSAGFFADFKAKITGELTTGTAELNITIGNTAPTITFIEDIIDVTPSESAANFTTFIFTADDIDGVANLDDSSPEARFQLEGETTRLNLSCVLSADIDGTSANYSCAVGMYYFDKNDANWFINVTIQDTNGARAINSSLIFTFTSLKAMVTSPAALTWPEFGVTATNQSSNNDPILINNTGNNVALSVNVTGLNLQGETTDTQFIFANNISVENVDPSCGGTDMINNTGTNITSAILERGNNSLNDQNATSGQEQAFFCVKGVNSDLSAQSYSSAAYGAWTITII